MDRLNDCSVTAIARNRTPGEASPRITCRLQILEVSPDGASRIRAIFSYNGNEHRVEHAYAPGADYVADMTERVAKLIAENVVTLAAETLTRPWLKC